MDSTVIHAMGRGYHEGVSVVGLIQDPFPLGVPEILTEAQMGAFKNQGAFM